MGLPGSGKTYLVESLQPLLEAAWYNADKVREMANDWNFSPEGRIRQSMRMRAFADFEEEVFDEQIHSISATKIRKELREKGDLK